MHRNLIIYLSALAALSPTPSSALRHGAHQLRDVFAYPKYEVQYLNDMPLASSDAERCKVLGVDTEEEWLTLRPPRSERKSLGDGSDTESASTNSDRLSLIPINFSPGDEGDSAPYPYLCLLPSSNTTSAQTARMDQEDEMDEVDPAQGWAALSHLDGKCLYSRQGWFTYSYCHNSHIRQFRQAPHPHPHPPGGFVPEEDPKYDAYTLGQAQPTVRKLSKSKVKSVKARAGTDDLQVQSNKPPTAVDTASHDHTRSVSFGLGASSRYLVQKWSDGTRCDKTGQPRQVEIQVHCSMTTGDMIYMVKELAICSYVVIIHSPHLCGLPGFKAEHAEVEMAPIRCRQVIPDEDFERWDSGVKEGEEEAKHKLGLPFSDKPAGAKSPDQDSQHRFGLPPPINNEPGKQQDGLGGTDSKADTAFVFASPDADENFRNMLTRALEIMANRKGGDKVQDLGLAPGNDGEQEGEEELVLVSWEENEDGAPVLLEAEVLGGEEKAHLTREEKEALQRMMRDHLRGEEEGDDEGDGEQGRLTDEL